MEEYFNTKKKGNKYEVLISLIIAPSRGLRYLSTCGYERLAAQNNFKFIVVIFPQRFQVQKEDWKMTVERYGLRPECFDLMKPNRLISDYCKRNGIICIDPTV
nr:hypothetical protein [Candidatus Omnitrophota bacterium]